MASCSKTEVVEKEQIRPVRYEAVFLTGSSKVRTFSGAAQAGQESNLSFKVGGSVLSVNVNVGDKVTTGQILAVLDDNDYRLQVQEAEASLEQAMAQARNAKSAYDRARALYENRNASKSDLDAARAGSESAEAAVKSIEKRLELARLQVSYTKLKAPVAGSIASVSIEVNENVSPGSPIVMLSSGKRPEVKVNVPEVLIDQVRKNNKVNVWFDAIPNKEFSATIVEVGVSSTGYGSTYPVTVRIDHTSSKIRPGMAAEVALNFNRVAGRRGVLVPVSAVGEDREGRFVFVVEPGENEMGVVRKTAVTIGEISGEGLEVLEGLSDGDLVVTAGVSKIVNGQKVKLL